MKLERISFFPNIQASNTAFKYRVVVGVGGNEGDVKKRFVKLMRYLQNDRRLHVVESSLVFKNPPFGYLEQNDFYNAVLVMQTSLAPKALLKILLHVEALFGRVRVFKNGPRTLDLDIIFFSNKRIHQKGLIVPHPRWMERLSVCVPLSMLHNL
ncbi:MAG: 2-amino-4-hydroxy-6-hydroxymethyldihydropteridine diphosphokinase [Sulfurospirillaceae bacterium]|nr:2-amino-4-hydroxy-6-hydroxymethyldihydropteridine diphosphokinase [Sulfurospirillaceae bacterium]MDD2825592.1 2-amino-4-hydroxy-6-hydroxymethyldihydropteridine diphosphokinase [Sulfurospirillaceae bacterium]